MGGLGPKMDLGDGVRGSFWDTILREMNHEPRPRGSWLLFLRCERSLAKGPEGTTYHRISSAAQPGLQRVTYITILLKGIP